jgi:hypothetical protein
VVVLSLAVGTLLDAALGRLEGNGTEEVWVFRHLGVVLQPGVVFVGDRIFSNFWV